MASINLKTIVPAKRTHEGAVAARLTPLQELIRTVMSCMLWEDNFYEDGVSIADRIKKLVHQVTLAEAAGVAVEARENMKLRHVPLLIAREMARHPARNSASVVRFNDANDTSIISETLARVIQRPDELSEFLAIYWKDGKQPLSKQVKRGLAKAFQKFNEYALAKYNRKKDIMLRDVLFLCHSKPQDVPADALPWDKAAREHLANTHEITHAKFVSGMRPQGFSEGELLYGRLIYDRLATPDTWEVELSKGGDKSAAWTRLLLEKKLGDLAFLRNLRNMRAAGLSDFSLAAYGDERRWGRVLPFRFIAAARMLPQLEPHLERWMLKCLEGAPKLAGRTALLIDVSGSMSSRISPKSDLSRLDAAKALAMLLREVCEEVGVYIFNGGTLHVPPRRGFALADAIGTAGGGTDVRQAVLRSRAHFGVADRTIIITDEQSATPLPAPENDKSYCLNVAAHRNGLGYGAWLHIDGFSEAVVDYILKHEEV